MCFCWQIPGGWLWNYGEPGNLRQFIANDSDYCTQKFALSKTLNRGATEYKILLMSFINNPARQVISVLIYVFQFGLLGKNLDLGKVMLPASCLINF